MPDQLIVLAGRSLQPGPDLTIDRARWKLAAMAHRLRALEAQLATEREHTDSMRKERDQESRRYERLHASKSYRLGCALVSLVENPIQAFPRLSRAALRRLRGHHATTVRPIHTATTKPSSTPVHLYVVIGLTAESVHEFVLTLRQRLLVNPDHRPVVLSDCPSFSLLRDLGMLLEYLPDRTIWEQHRPDLAWEELLSQRLTRLYADHDPTRTIYIDQFYPPTLAELLNSLPQIPR